MEKRKFRRIKKRLDVDISVGKYRIKAETHNISCSGAYCRVDRFIPLMSKVGILLLLPSWANNKAGDGSLNSGGRKTGNMAKREGCFSSRTNMERVLCEGVIVRCVPALTQGPKACYDVAIFFSKLSDDVRARISEFINRKPSAGG
jgi:hypothetical protein